MDYLERFEAILFDLNGTLADGYDRFGSDQDYQISYLRHGGKHLAAAEVANRIGDCLMRLLRRYDSALVDPFPPLREFLDVDGLPETEIRAIEATVAQHEIGHIPPPRIRFLQKLATSHELGLVSDLWAPARIYRAYLDSLGLTPLFGSMVFSCEHGAVKPSPRLFRVALDELDVAPALALFVGDSRSRDIAGAAACGMATVWISTQSRDRAPARPDRVVASVEELVGLV